MECKRVSKIFKIVGIEGRGAFTSFNTEIPLAAQQFLVRRDEIDNGTGTEIALFEPKKDTNHLEGHYYVGMTVNEKQKELPAGMSFIELNQDFVMTRGNMNDIGELHNHLLNWSEANGFKRNLDMYIVETYHPMENGEEEVEVFLPIHT